jgi:hypothetical protein
MKDTHEFEMELYVVPFYGTHVVMSYIQAGSPRM